MSITKGNNWKLHLALFACALVALASVTRTVHAANDSKMDGKTTVSIPVTQLQYFKAGVTDGVHGELQAAPAYGDMTHSGHGTFIKMPAGFVSPIHIHTADYWGVVISGVGVNTPVGGTDVTLPVGSYWFQKGGERHVTKCVSSNECIFFINQSAKFDYVPDKQ